MVYLQSQGALAPITRGRIELNHFIGALKRNIPLFPPSRVAYCRPGGVGRVEGVQVCFVALS